MWASGDKQKRDYRERSSMNLLSELCRDEQEDIRELKQAIEKLKTQRNEALMLLVRLYYQMTEEETDMNTEESLWEVADMIGSVVSQSWPKGWDLRTTLVELRHLDE